MIWIRNAVVFRPKHLTTHRNWLIFLRFAAMNSVNFKRLFRFLAVFRSPSSATHEMQALPAYSAGNYSLFRCVVFHRRSGALPSLEWPPLFFKRRPADFMKIKTKLCCNRRRLRAVKNTLEFQLRRGGWGVIWSALARLRKLVVDVRFALHVRDATLVYASQCCCRVSNTSCNWKKPNKIWDTPTEDCESKKRHMSLWLKPTCSLLVWL